MQRIHISPRLGQLPITEIRSAHIEAVANAMLRDGRAPKTVRNVVSFLYSIFEHAIDRGYVRENPVRPATRPGRRRSGDVTQTFSSSPSRSSRPCSERSPTTSVSARGRPHDVADPGRRRRHRRTSSDRCCA